MGLENKFSKVNQMRFVHNYDRTRHGNEVNTFPNI